ncbi:MAG: WbqC family protein [Acidobacteria bacterium]|nr:WbqC family protein [Acidobacteriota bacterium]
MVLGLMQPYFFPYLGYFDLISRADGWIAFDTAQYIRRGWVNRNRILHPAAGWQYVTVPVRRHRRSTPISEICIDGSQPWAARIEGQLRHYRRHAPYYEAVMALVGDCLHTGEPSLARLNLAALGRVCTYIGLPFEGRFLSEMGLTLGPIEGPGDWALRVAEALGAAAYLNPSRGSALFSPAAFASSGIELRLLPPPVITYACPGYVFEPALSILDVLMWLSPEEVRGVLRVARQGAVAPDSPP